MVYFYTIIQEQEQGSEFKVMCVCAELLHCVWLFVTQYTVACQALLSMGFSTQEYWGGLPCPPTGDLSDPGIAPSSLMSLMSCEEVTHWKRPWCWEGLGAGGEGDNRGWDGWMASPTRWAWVWVNSWSWWWTGRPGVLLFMGSQRVGHDWAIELNW